MSRINNLTRLETLQLFLGLCNACEMGVVNDVLWMPEGHCTMFEFLLDAVDHPGDWDADIFGLTRWLEAEIAKEKTV